MNIPVQLNGSPQTSTVAFATEADLVFVTDWEKVLGDDKNPKRLDAIEFATVAAMRYRNHSAIDSYATSISDIKDHISADPKTEVACCALLKCEWFPASHVIGLMHFRRTWCNNLFLDYLAVHPFVAESPSDYAHTVKGAGAALLYFLSTLARDLDCSMIWGEATAGSCEYYQNVFALKSVKDSICIPRENFILFISSFDEKLKRGAKTKDVELEKLYALEEKSSLSVGTKIVMLNPRRRLALRFLALPSHSQIAIGNDLGLIQEEDKNQPINEQLRRVFVRATEAKRLSDLWREVENLHPDGEPNKNPFLKR